MQHPQFLLHKRLLSEHLRKSYVQAFYATGPRIEVPLTKTRTQYQHCLGFPSLRRRRDLTPVSKVCKAAPISLFWGPNTQRITGYAF